tara:strand:+ start:810 stop:1130 length:321 start_codon:yes stop_codon:yes gene_type:complete
MFENIKMILSANKEHLQSLRYDMKDAERKYLNNEYTLKQFIEILEHCVRVGSAPMINTQKLSRKYINDFCLRNNIDKYSMQNQIRNMLSPNLPQFDGNWYFSKTKK